MPKRNEVTSKRTGKLASKLLSAAGTSKSVKSVAGSALTQRPDKKQAPSLIQVQKRRKPRA